MTQPTPQKPIMLYGFKLSGHSHRAESMLRLLQLPYEYREVNLRGGEQKSETFLKLNPFGTVPVIDDNGTVIADSAAILVYLATTYEPARRWLPREAAQAAQVQRWLSVAQGPVYNGPAMARMVKLFGAPADYERCKAIASSLFSVLENHLASEDFLVGERPTIADVAVYSYIAVSADGGLPLSDYGAIRSWVARLEALPHFEPMPGSDRNAV
ncbi:glutathione S-transferase [Dongia soli]|uniref:Glutathione S-transferase n=1 Tax=Dongia soli TaxID=600628 RepID=A0ABU5EGM8_9PROT|nr:glutathione S-transferase [Dongia soli]MDY0885052.1 glutathione S-transferase [Dongia soli]